MDTSENIPTSAVNGINHVEKVAILDAGAQYGKIIDTVRELNVESFILPINTPAKQLETEGYNLCGT